MPEKPKFKTNLSITTDVGQSKSHEMKQALTKARDKAKGEASVTYSGSYGATYRPSLKQQRRR